MKSIPLPEKMEHLKLDSRGYPIPYIILIDDKGQPHFKINDDAKVQTCVRWKLCAVCGSSMKKDMWTIGGPMSAFHERGVYIDTPVHHQCGTYALQVCPYLAAPNYLGHGDIEKIVSKVESDKHTVYVDPTVNPTRPELFVFSHISNFIIEKDGAARYVKPDRPYIDIEFWQKGVQLSFESGLQIIDLYYPGLSTENMLRY